MDDHEEASLGNPPEDFYRQTFAQAEDDLNLYDHDETPVKLEKNSFKNAARQATKEQ